MIQIVAQLPVAQSAQKMVSAWCRQNVKDIATAFEKAFTTNAKIFTV